jgi:hypothetical protein
MPVLKMNAAWLPQDVRSLLLRFAVDWINPSSHNIYHPNGCVRVCVSARTRTPLHFQPTHVLCEFHMVLKQEFLIEQISQLFELHVIFTVHFCTIDQLTPTNKEISGKLVLVHLLV